MLNANNIRDSIDKEFQENFNFKVFDDYLNDYFINQKGNHLNIGLEPDRYFKHGIPNIGACTNYIWTTSIQVPVRYWNQVRKYLEDSGFKTCPYKAPGYDDWDILKVSI